jgi:hypothetical protein
MPLVGFKCCHDHEVKPFQECIDKCRRGDCLYPLHLLARIPRKLGEREGIAHDFSATALTMCPRAFALQDRCDYAEHPQDFYARDSGDAHHAWIDRSGPFEGVHQETRKYKDYTLPNGHTFTLSGKADWVDTTLREIGDFKRTKFAPKQPYESHQIQVNVYADLWAEEFEPERLWVEYFDGTYHKHDVRVWSEGERYAFIVEKGEELLKTRVLEDYLPPRLPDYPKAMNCKYCPVLDECEELAD